jgi:hypothetical protein
MELHQETQILYSGKSNIYSPTVTHAGYIGET